MTLITREAIINFFSSRQETAEDSLIDYFHSRVQHLHHFTSQKTEQQLRNFISNLKEKNTSTYSKYVENVLRLFMNYRGEKTLTDFELLQEKIEVLFIEMAVFQLKKERFGFTNLGSLSLDKLLEFFIDPLPYDELSLRGTKRCSNVSCSACKKGDAGNCFLIKSKSRALDLKSRLQAKLEKRKALSK